MVVRLDKPQKNSKGEWCNWAVIQHTTKRILGKFTSKELAEKFLKQIEMFKHMDKK